LNASDAREGRNGCLEQLQPLGLHLRAENGIACDVAARMGKALHQPGAHDIAHSDHHDGNRRGPCFGRDARRRPPSCNYIHRATGEIGRGLGEPLGRAIGTAIFKRNVGSGHNAVQQNKCLFDHLVGVQ